MMNDQLFPGRAGSGTVQQRTCQSCLRWLVLLAVLPAIGCSSLIPEMVPFGAVNGTDMNRSLNGLGVHRKMWESAGAKCLTPQKLSPRLESFDVIVLVGQSYGPPGKAARDWLERWLAEKDGRSLVYFGRDFNAAVYYRQRTYAQLDDDRKPRAAFQQAKFQTDELNLRLRELPESTFCGWFYMDVGPGRRSYDTFTGPWASNLDGLAGSWPVGVTLQPPENKWRTQRPSWLQGTAKNNLQPASTLQETDDEGLVKRSTWEFDELANREQWNSQFRKRLNYKTLLAGGDQQPLIFRVTGDDFEGSQILIAANGAPLLNGSLVDPLHRKVGKLLVEECLPAKRVALVAYGSNGLLITSAPETDARGAGLEMLTVWPMSAITMAAALLGIVVCGVLLPILGRPQSLPRRSVTDFGLHVEAVGRMLLDARDMNYAKQVITEYFQKVRGEAAPPWLAALSDPRQPSPAPEVSAVPPTAPSQTAPSQTPASQTPASQATPQPESATANLREPRVSETSPVEVPVSTPVDSSKPMSSGLRELYDRHAFSAFDQQLALGDQHGNSDWTYNKSTGQLLFTDDGVSYSVQVLGIEDHIKNVWRWAWADKISDFPSESLEAAKSLREYGMAFGIEELTQGEISLDRVIGEWFAIVGSGQCNAKAYFPGGAPGKGVVYFLITDERLRLPDHSSVARAASVIPQAIGALPIKQHAKAIESYLIRCGLNVAMEDAELLARRDGNIQLRAVFDTMGRLVQLKSESELS